MSVARGFGDISLKEPVGVIVPTPDVDIISITPDAWFCVIACDGEPPSLANF
jgi:hypothetical protein